jgi:flagellar hook assembly protein FlgD
MDEYTLRTNEATYIYENHDNVNKKISVFPNPMKNHAVITSVFSPGNPVDADIYSIAGIKIRTLLKGYVSPGTLQIYWDGVGDNGSEVASGIYFCRIVTKSFYGVCKIIKN